MYVDPSFEIRDPTNFINIFHWKLYATPTILPGAYPFAIKGHTFKSANLTTTTKFFFQMAQTDFSNVSSNVSSSGGHVNRREAAATASAVPSRSLTAAAADVDDPFVTGSLFVNITKCASDLLLGPMVAAVAQAEAMDTAPDFPNRNPNASGVRACCPADLVHPVHPMNPYYVVTVGKCIGIYDSQ